MRNNERKIRSNLAPSAGLSLPFFAWALAGSLFFVLVRINSGEPAREDEIGSDLGSVQQRAILAERRALSDLRSRGEIGDDAFHRVEEELDWAEVHVARQPASE